MSEDIVTIDVRDEIRVGRDPWPLIGMLAIQGYAAKILPLDETDFEVLFSATAGTAGVDESLL